MPTPISRRALARAASILSAAIACAFLSPPSHADEGMWLFTSPPTQYLQDHYKFSTTPQWLEHVQKSAVRFGGGSGSLVSADGLVMTNHHVGSGTLLRLSTPQWNLLKEGFWAKDRSQELPCPALELSVLWQIEDVTSQVLAAAKDGMSTAEAGKARRQAIASIEKTSKDSTGLKSDVVSLYGGSMYHLYRYKSYTDIRLVFAPEEEIAFFGGDTDNFEFPRYNLDCCFFRIYDNGKPLKPEHFLSWSQNGAAENDLVFVAGHPGRTDRLHTYEHLKIDRDIELPRRLAELWRREVKVQTFAGRSAENARIIRDELFGTANGRKSLTGRLEGLQDPALMSEKQNEEDRLRSQVNDSAPMKAKWASAWDDVARVKKAEQAFAERRDLIDRVANASRLMRGASTLVQLADELPLPSAQRLREYGDARLDSLYLRLYSPEPVYDSREAFDIAQALSRAAERLGGDDPMVVMIFAGKSPTERADELVQGCTLRDPAARKALAAGGKQAIADSKDPMIRFAIALDPEVRRLRKQFEDTVDSPLRDAYSKIAAARFAVFGQGVCPDATGTLRLSFGPIKSISGAGETVPAFTNFAGLYQRAAERKGREGFVLPARWIAAKDKLNPATPFNFICTADIIGGNSGSPIVNTRAEIVGLIFDGNIDSLAGDYMFNNTTGRAVGVDSRGMIEAIRTVYGAENLATELTGQTHN